MFWKKIDKQPTFTTTYVAVLEVKEINRDGQCYGKHEYEFKLADGTVVTRTFEQEENKKLWSSIFKGGQIIN